MAGEYIEFNNNSQPAINDTNLNRLQQLIKQDIQGAVNGDTLPVGVIVPYGSNTIPENWLLCDGSAVSRETYQDLFNTIGITYGAGDGFTTFNLPDLQGRVVVGKDDNDTDFNTLGETGGEKTHTLTINEMPRHTHTQKLGGNISTVDNVAGDYIIGDANTANVSYAGGDRPHNIMQPYQVQNYIIKAFQSSGVVAEVVQTQTNSDEDVYSCNYINNLTKVLYKNITGTTDVTLSDSVANYDYIEIIYRENVNNKIYSTGKLFGVNGKKTTLSYMEFPSDASGNLYVSGASYSVNNNKITIDNQYGLCAVNNNNDIIYQNRVVVIGVLGYKEV